MAGEACNNVGVTTAKKNANISGQGIIFKLFLPLSTRTSSCGRGSRQRGSWDEEEEAAKVEEAEAAADKDAEEDVSVDVAWVLLGVSVPAVGCCCCSDRTK